MENNIDNINETEAMQYDTLLCPVKIFVCHCKQCTYVKNKRKNRKLKKKIKRLMNKKRRKEKHNGKIVSFYWA